MFTHSTPKIKVHKCEKNKNSKWTSLAVHSDDDDFETPRKLRGSSHSKVTSVIDLTSPLELKPSVLEAPPCMKGIVPSQSTSTCGHGHSKLKDDADDSSTSAVECTWTESPLLRTVLETPNVPSQSTSTCPTSPVEPTLHEVITQPTFFSNKIRMRFLPELHSPLFWEPEHNFAVYQRLYDGRHNVEKHRVRSICFEAPADSVMRFHIDGKELPEEFRVTRWDPDIHVDERDDDRFPWRLQKMGFKVCEYIQEHHANLFVDPLDNFVILQRDICADGAVQLFEFSFIAPTGCCFRFTTPALLFVPSKRMSMKA